MALNATPARMRCLYIFNRNGVCLHYHVWLRPLSTLQPSEDQKLMFGILFSLKSFVSKLDPTSSGDQPTSFRSFRTNTYKLHFLESASGLKIVLLTDPRMGDLRDALKHIYTNIYVEYVVNNPLYVPGQPFRCELFNIALDQYVKTLTV